MTWSALEPWGSTADLEPSAPAAEVVRHPAVTSSESVFASCTSAYTKEACCMLARRYSRALRSVERPTQDIPPGSPVQRKDLESFSLPGASQVVASRDTIPQLAETLRIKESKLVLF